jgi:molybdenum cofactor cytidylyltransferase
LQNLQGSAGARFILRANVAFSLEVDDVGCVTDIDTVDDLAAAQAILGRS